MFRADISTLAFSTPAFSAPPKLLGASTDPEHFSAVVTALHLFNCRHPSRLGKVRYDKCSAPFPSASKIGLYAYGRILHPQSVAEAPGTDGSWQSDVRRHYGRLRRQQTSSRRFNDATVTAEVYELRKKISHNSDKSAATANLCDTSK